MAKRLFDPTVTAPFALSRTKLHLFHECPRCFYLDRRLGIGRPSGPPFTLNEAVDQLLKREFDLYRAVQKPHPLMTEAGIDAIPAQRPELEKWRHNFTGVRHNHTPSGFEVFGAIDDLWIDRISGAYIVVDYKATAKEGEVGLDADWQISYKRQMETYQWLLRANGLPVSDTGYFVYCNGRKQAERFDANLAFKISVLPYTGKTDWVEPALLNAAACLRGPLPPPKAECGWCRYLSAGGRLAEGSAP
jgi:hypothetical protein